MAGTLENGATVRGVTRRPIRWHVEPAWRERLPLPLDELLSTAPFETIKHGRFRTIYRLKSEPIDLYVKHCRPVGVRAWLRELLRPAKAVLEFRKIVAVAARRVATLEPVACGTAAGCGPGDSFLITRSLNDATSLDHFLTVALPAFPEPKRSQFRQRLATGLGSFLADTHSAGVWHPDLHPGNLLVTWVGAAPRFTLIDLHDARIRRSLSGRDRLNNLIPFNRWFILRANRSDRLRFWHAYCVRSGQDPAVAPGLEAQTWRSNLRFWRGRERRCVVTNRHFRALRGPGMSGHAVREFQADELAALLRDPDRPFREPQRPLLKDSPSATVAEFDWPVGGTTGRVVLKRFRVTSRWDGPASFVRPSPALRSWINGHAFLDGLLPTPRPLAVWHRKRGGMSSAGYLLTEMVTKAVNLRQFVIDLGGFPPALSRERLCSLIDEVARAVRLLHTRGWSHRDLKASNVLVDRDGRVSFIDLVGVRRPWRLTETRRARDLARLNASFLAGLPISRTDRLRFLRMYLNWALHGRRDWKLWWRRVASATDRKKRRNLRSGRPLA